jgi:hypothetical protein
MWLQLVQKSHCQPQKVVEKGNKPIEAILQLPLENEGILVVATETTELQIHLRMNLLAS